MAARPDHGGHQLPRYLTSFVGREEVIREVTELLLREDVRLLTLIGPGGAGKTRLAVEIATRLDPASWDGIWYVPLVAIRDPALVLPAIAQALGVQQVGDIPVVETITHVIRDRRALLVIDNFEIVTGAAPGLVEILAACPYASMLVTSRIALRVSGEHLYVLPPLRTPIAADLNIEGLQSTESVQLFLQRARASGRTLDITDENAADIAGICRRLDGLPLAIELAAARSGVVSPAALLALLSRGPGILTGGPHDAHERHRSMHAAITWSYDLLSGEEQRVFRNLAVFSGGFTLEAASAVVAHQGDLLGILDSLIAKSLITPVASDDASARFTMLETLREFGQERLAESGELAEACDRHAAWFLTIAENSDFAWLMPLEEGLERIRQIRLEQGNIRAALAWLRQSGDIGTGLHMASQLGTLWVVLGNSAEGQRWLEELLQEFNMGDEILRAKGLAILSWISNQHGQDQRAFELSEEALSLYRAHDVVDGIIQCLVLSGVAASRIRHLVDTAIARHREAIDLMKAIRRPAWINNSIAGELSQLGQITLLEGDLQAAEILFREAWNHLSGNGARFLYGNGLLLWTAHLSRARGDDVSALQYYQQTLELAHRGFHVKGCGTSIAGIAGALAGLGQIRQAARLFGATEALHQTYGIPFQRETFDIQRALGLPEPWARADDPVGVAERLRSELRKHHTKLIPLAPNHAALDHAWTEGRKLSLDDVVEEALAARADPCPTSAPNPPHDLTRREVEVLRLLAEGRSNRVIAETLSLSERTVEHHITHILTKLDLESRTAAATFALRHNLI